MLPGFKWLVAMLLSSLVAITSFVGGVLFLNKFMFIMSALATLALVLFLVGFKLNLGEWLRK